MKATFEVKSIEYTRSQTTIRLSAGPTDTDDEERMGEVAAVVLLGCRPLNLQPEQLVTLAIHDRPVKPKARP